MSLPASDTFAGAAGVLAGSWTQQDNNPSVTLNQDGSGSAVPSAFPAGDEEYVFWNADAFAADQFAEVTIGAYNSLGYVDVSVRATGSTKATTKNYNAYVNSAGDLGISKWINGVQTILSSGTTVAFAIGDRLKLLVVGSTLTVYKNDVQVLTTTDGAIATGSAGFGFYTGASPVAITDWNGSNFAVGYQPWGLETGVDTWGTEAGDEWITEASDAAPAGNALGGTCRVIARAACLALASVLTLSPAPVRATARAGQAAITQAQSVAGTVRAAPRLVGSLPVIAAIAGTVRSTPRLAFAQIIQAQPVAGRVRAAPRLSGASVAQLQALTGSVRAAARLPGAALTQAQPLAGVLRSSARAAGVLAQSQAIAGRVRVTVRLSGTIAQAQTLAGVARSGGRLLGGSVTQAQTVRGTIRATALLPGATLTIPAPGTTAIAGTSRTSARLRGFTITQALSLGSGVARAIARSTGLLTQAVPLVGFTRAASRTTGALAQAQAVLGKVRGAARLQGLLAGSVVAAVPVPLEPTGIRFAVTRTGVLFATPSPTGVRFAPQGTAVTFAVTHTGVVFAATSTGVRFT